MRENPVLDGAGQTPEQEASEVAITSSGMLDVEELSEQLGVSVRFVRRLVYERRIPYYKVGKFVRFDPETIDQWVQQNRIDPEGPLAGRPGGRRRHE